MLTDAHQIQLNVRLNKCVSYVKHFILTCGTATAEFQTTGVQAPDCQAALSEKVRQQIATGLQIQSQTDSCRHLDSMNVQNLWTK